MKVLSFDVGTRTLSYCMLEHAQGDVLTVHGWETIDVHAEAGLPGKAHPTLKEDSEYVLNVLHARKHRFWEFTPDAVIIEQQPAGGNNRFCSVRMKCISHVIHAFFYILQLEHAGMGAQQNAVPVSFVSPSSKLAGMDKGETPEETQARQSGNRTVMTAKYKRNKKYAVDTTAALLVGMTGPEAALARATFEDARGKQDDLSDCFMLAYAFAVKGTRKRKR